nr:hypothetical protein [Tanacetum cinerariifolium]
MKNVIQYPRFTKLIIADLMDKFVSIPKRLEEDYHTIKDDTLLVNVYTTGEVTVCGMLITNELLTDAIRDTQAYTDYIEKFERVHVHTIQPEPVESTQGMNRTPRANRTPNHDDVVQKKRKGKQAVGELNKTAKAYEEQQNMAAVKKRILDEDVENIVVKDKELGANNFVDTILFSDDDFGERLEPGSHKENPKKNDVDVDEKKDDKKNDEDDNDDDDTMIMH